VPATTDRVRVSVVIPVFDTGEYLLPALRSLEEQDLPADQFEVVAVDDGSTDGSGDVLDDWASTHPNVQVLHQANSGWPGQPRNRGTAVSRGEYVLYMDADDFLAPHTLRRLHEFATAHGSDIVVPRLTGVGGRWTSHRPWPRTEVDADLRRVFLTLSPQKLFRREFLQEHDLRFPEGRVRLEDGMFLARAYLSARRVSTLSDGDYYFLRERAGGGNISAAPLDPAGYLGSVATIGRTVRELCPDAPMADEIVLDLYRRKALKVFAPDRFLGYRPALRSAWTEAVRVLAEELVPVALEQRLPEPFRTRSALARAGDVDGQVEHARLHSPNEDTVRLPAWRRVLNSRSVGSLRPLTAERGLRLQDDLQRVGLSSDGLVLDGRVRLRGAPPVHLRLQLVLRLRGRPKTRPLLMPVRTGKVGDGGWQVWQAAVPQERLATLAAGTWDVFLRVRRGGLEQRLGPRSTSVELPDDLPLPARDGRLAPYVTVRGNLSLRLSGAPVRGRGGR
jgi:poly(ribitol-phosphate) beta-N-acetylglucosaminyltransferase